MSIIQGGGVIYVSDDKNESFSSLLPRYYTALTDKILALRIINAMSSNMFDDFLSLTKDKFDKKVESSLSPEDKIEYLFKMGRGILALVGWGYKTENPKISKLLDEETEMYHNREDIRRALKEMMLVYLVIIFEEFLTNVLSALFRKRHDVFRSSRKSIEYVEVLEHSDIYE
ncbi:MAG TPA: hypothetical protein VFR94_14525 [Nitrososphaeraceae archaeon]|nr:hypothetical protein [Nitrososphaeraceae archaeon]